MYIGYWTLNKYYYYYYYYYYYPLIFLFSNMVKLASQQASIIFFRLFFFISSAHSLIAGKCLCRVRDMMTTNDGNSKCCQFMYYY